MKYRVKQIGQWFYPQYKWLCIWVDIKEKRFVQTGELQFTAARCLTLDNAKCKITEHKISQKHEKQVVKIWEINE